MRVFFVYVAKTRLQHREFRNMKPAVGYFSIIIPTCLRVTLMTPKYQLRLACIELYRLETEAAMCTWLDR